MGATAKLEVVTDPAPPIATTVTASPARVAPLVNGKRYKSRVVKIKNGVESPPSAYFTAFTPAAPVTDPNPGTVPYLKVVGKNIVTDDARAIVMNRILRGVNVHEGEWQIKSQGVQKAKDIESMFVGEAASARWGGNVMSFGFATAPVDRVRRNAASLLDDHYVQLLDHYVALAEQHRMYVVFAPRWKEINADPQFSLPDMTVDSPALTFLARRYKGNPHVIYATQVETHNAGAHNPGGTDYNQQLLNWNETIKPRWLAMIDSIHNALGPTARKPIIMVSGNNYGRQVNPAKDSPIDRPNIVYKAHFYQPRSRVNNWFGLLVAQGTRPVWIGEFGRESSGRVGEVITDAMNREQLAYMNDNDLGGAAWACTNGGEPHIFENRALPLTPATYGGTSTYGVDVQNWMKVTAEVPAK